MYYSLEVTCTTLETDQIHPPFNIALNYHLVLCQVWQFWLVPY